MFTASNTLLGKKRDDEVNLLIPKYMLFITVVGSCPLTVNIYSNTLPLNKEWVLSYKTVYCLSFAHGLTTLLSNFFLCQVNKNGLHTEYFKMHSKHKFCFWFNTISVFRNASLTKKRQCSFFHHLKDLKNSLSIYIQFSYWDTTIIYIFYCTYNS